MDDNVDASEAHQFVQMDCFDLRVCLVGGVEKWEDRKLWNDGKVERWKIFSFPSYVFGWKGGKVWGWKTLLFGWREKRKDEKCNLYKLTIIPLLHNR